MTYYQEQEFEFNQEKSGNNKESDSFFVLNGPLFGALQAMEARSGNYLLLMRANQYWEASFDGEEIKGPFVKINVGDYLWNGFKFCKTSNPFCTFLKTEVNNVKTLEVDNDGSISFAFFRHVSICRIYFSILIITFRNLLIHLN